MEPKLKLNTYEFFELDLLVGVGVNSEHIPEHVLEIALVALVEDLNDQQFKLLLSQELTLDVVLVQGPEFRPDLAVESLLLGSAVANRGVWEPPAALEVAGVPTKVPPDEGDVLLVADESIVVGVDVLEDQFKQGLIVLDLHPLSAESDELKELLEVDEALNPLGNLAESVLPQKDDLGEEQFQEDLGHLGVKEVTVLANVVSEKVLDHVVDFGVIQQEDLA